MSMLFIIMSRALAMVPRTTLSVSDILTQRFYDHRSGPCDPGSPTARHPLWGRARLGFRGSPGPG